jgi:predicted MFS family arabinose efflux permease
VPLERRQVAISRFLVAVILGQLMGSTFAGLIEGQVGWRGVFAITAAVAAAGFLAVLFGFDRAGRSPPQALAVGPAVARYRTILATPRARVLFSAVFVEAIAIFGVFPYLAPLLAEQGGGPREAGLVLAGFAVGGLLYSALVPVLLRFLGIYRMLVTGGVLCAASLLVVGLTGYWPLDSAAFLGLGAGFYMLHNTFQVQVTEVAPTARGSAVALHAFSYFCGQAISVAIFGAMLEHLGRLPALAACAVTILLLGILTSIRLARREA